jgi:hypothetical protein
LLLNGKTETCVLKPTVAPQSRPKMTAFIFPFGDGTSRLIELLQSPARLTQAAPTTATAISNVRTVIRFESMRVCPTAELTRRRESKHLSPEHSSYETRYRRSRPTICYAASAQWWRNSTMTEFCASRKLISALSFGNQSSAFRRR